MYIKKDKLLVLFCVYLFQVKLDKVDMFYPFHPSSLVDIKNDTRLKFTSQEAAAWLDDLSE
jgi:ubiquitin conjugation factor E4 B